MNCLHCGKIKEASDFYPGNKSRCKACVGLASAEWRSRNKARDRLRQKRYYAANQAKITAASLARYYNKKDEILPRLRARSRERRKDDPAVKLTHGIQKRMSQVIRGGCPRDWRVLLGYDPRLLVPHLEALFEPWMSWENYGTEWHVDHRRPVSSFNLPEQIRECWALSNLRPLRALDNLQKGAKWLPETTKKPPSDHMGHPEA